MSIDEFVSVQVSSRKTPKQRGILELLKRLEPGDILLVSELSRLGRSVGQIIQMLDDLVTNRVRFVGNVPGLSALDFANQKQFRAQHHYDK